MSHEKFQFCVEASLNCAVKSKQCASACLDELDIQKLARCIRLNHDTAAICLFAMEAMEGGSEFVQRIYQLCSDICAASAKECEKFPEYEYCRDCAEACRNCVGVCEGMC